MTSLSIERTGHHVLLTASSCLRYSMHKVPIRDLKQDDAFNKTSWPVLPIDKCYQVTNLSIERTGHHVLLMASSCLRYSMHKVPIRELKQDDAFNKTSWPVLPVDKCYQVTSLSIERTGHHVLLMASSCLRYSMHKVPIRDLKQDDAFNKTSWSVLPIDKCYQVTSLSIERTGHHVLLTASSSLRYSVHKVPIRDLKQDDAFNKTSWLVLPTDKCRQVTSLSLQRIDHYVRFTASCCLRSLIKVRGILCV